MKTIHNQKLVYITKEPNATMTAIEDKHNDSDYFKLIEESCNRPTNPQLGFTYDDIKSIDRVKKAIKAAKKEVMSVEDKDFDFIKSRVETKSWASSSIEIADFVDYIKGIK